MICIGDNGTPFGITLEEAKTEIFEGGVRVPMIIADGQALVNEINGQAIVPRFLHTSRINATAPQMIHVVDLYATIVRLIDPAANSFPADMDAKDFSVVLKNPIISRPTRPPFGGGGVINPPQPPVTLPKITLPVRFFNFSQWYSASSGTRATIRNASYKLNYDESAGPDFYSLFQYVDGEIPGLEDGTAVDLYNDAINGINVDAQTNLNLLLDELRTNYQQDEDNAFP